MIKRLSVLVLVIVAAAWRSGTCHCKRRFGRRSWSTKAGPAERHGRDPASDKSTPIVHASSGITSARRTKKTGRTGFAQFFEHLSFKGSSNVARAAHLDHCVGRGRPTPTPMRTPRCFGRRFPRVPAARDVDGGGSNGVAPHRREDVRHRARSRQGRAPDAHRESAVGLLNELISFNAFDVHTYGTRSSASMTDLKPRRSTTSAISTRPTTAENATLMVSAILIRIRSRNLVNQ